MHVHCIASSRFVSFPIVPMAQVPMAQVPMAQIPMAQVQMEGLPMNEPPVGVGGSSPRGTSFHAYSD